jgi:hypothetical protein
MTTAHSHLTLVHRELALISPHEPASTVRFDIGQPGSTSLFHDSRTHREHDRPPPHLLLLGVPELRYPGGSLDTVRRQRLVELAAYLVLCPGRDEAALRAAMWPGRDVKPSLPSALLGRLRRWLGNDPYGEPYVPAYSRAHGYRLHPAVTTDWQRWQAMLPHPPASATTQDLEAALWLVRGYPLDGRSRPARYGWAEEHRRRMVSSITAAALELAERYLVHDDWALAEHAVHVGLRVDSAHPRLWQTRLHTARLMPQGQAHQGGMNRLLRLAATLDETGEPGVSERLVRLARTQGLETRSTSGIDGREAPLGAGRSAAPAVPSLVAEAVQS